MIDFNVKSDSQEQQTNLQAQPRRFISYKTSQEFYSGVTLFAFLQHLL